MFVIYEGIKTDETIFNKTDETQKINTQREREKEIMIT